MWGRNSEWESERKKAKQKKVMKVKPKKRDRQILWERETEYEEEGEQEGTERTVHSSHTGQHSLAQLTHPNEQAPPASGIASPPIPLVWENPLPTPEHGAYAAVPIHCPLWPLCPLWNNSSHCLGLRRGEAGEEQLVAPWRWGDGEALWPLTLLVVRALTTS